MPLTSWGSVRLVEIPDAAPPYDCETHGAVCRAALANEKARGCGLAAAEEARRAPAWTPAATAGAGAGDAGTGDAGTGSAAAGGAAAAGAWARQFAQVMVEILAGVRPARQVVPLATDRVRAQIRHLGPVLAADRRPVIKRIVTSRPTATVVEMTVVVSAGSRSRALAMRLEHVAGRQSAPGLPARPARWLCTELEAG
jgi:Family of unknown function (DUF6459)